MFREKKLSRGQYYGKRILTTTNAEGSVVAFHRGVPVYGGDIFAGAENKALWARKDRFFLMASSDSLSRDYNMRGWASETPDGGYMSCPYGRAGQKVASSFSWRYGEEDLRVPFDFYVPGTTTFSPRKAASTWSSITTARRIRQNPFPANIICLSACTLLIRRAISS